MKAYEIKEAVQVKAAVVLELNDGSKKVVFVDDCEIADRLAFEINDGIALNDDDVIENALIDSEARFGAKTY